MEKNNLKQIQLCFCDNQQKGSLLAKLRIFDTNVHFYY